MHIKRLVATAGLIGTVTAASLTVGVAPASADLTTVHNDHHICTNSGGSWTDYGLGEHIRYACLNQYLSGWVLYYYLATGEITSVVTGTGALKNGASGGDYHTP